MYLDTRSKGSGLGQTDRPTDRPTDRQTDRQTNIIFRLWSNVMVVVLLYHGADDLITDLPGCREAI